jgi:sterol desaturase/sphingolipid hydroxylase (fatty acid hydroxylase superfamily)
MSLGETMVEVGVVFSTAVGLVLLPFELWRLRRRGQLDGSVFKEVLASASPFIPTLLLSGVTLAWALWLSSWVERFSGARLPVNLLSLLGLFVLVDLTYYFEHRASHRVRLLWAISHSVHHSSPHYNQATGLRVSFVDGFTAPFFYLPLVALGYEPGLVFGMVVLNLSYQQWIHTELVGSLPWLDGWLNTPSNHRVHHSSEQPYLDKNFGGVFMLWDRVFGTYAAQVGETTYGLTTPQVSQHPWDVHFAEVRAFLDALRATPRLRDRLARLVHGPDWEPPRVGSSAERVHQHFD